MLKHLIQFLRKRLVNVFMSGDKKKERYIRKQVEWVLDNNIQKGDLVRIMTSAKNYQDGWPNIWESRMSLYVGATGTVNAVAPGRGIQVKINNTSYYYPYFVLLKMTNPEEEITPGPEPIQLKIPLYLEGD